MRGWAKILPVALLCLAALGPWTGVSGQDGLGQSLAPGIETGTGLAAAPGAAIPLAAPGPDAAPGPGAQGFDEEVVNTMEAELDEMVLNEAMGPTAALATGAEGPAAQGPEAAADPSVAALAPARSSAPRSVGPPDASAVPSPTPVASPVPSAPADEDVAVADRILNKVREGDTEGAADEIVQAVSSGRVDAVTAAAVLARDEGLSSEMADALSATLLRGVRPSEVREAFAIVGSG